MKLDGCCESAVQKDCYSLPKYLNQSNPPEVSACPLGNQYDCLSHALLKHCTTMERCLHSGDNLMPFGGVRCVVLSGINQPLEEAFYLNH